MLSGREAHAPLKHHTGPTRTSAGVRRKGTPKEGSEERKNGAESPGRGRGFVLGLTASESMCLGKDKARNFSVSQITPGLCVAAVLPFSPLLDGSKLCLPLPCSFFSKAKCLGQ